MLSISEGHHRMNFVLERWQFLFAILAGWVSRSSTRSPPM
jgi:hypothetical protein